VTGESINRPPCKPVYYIIVSEKKAGQNQFGFDFITPDEFSNNPLIILKNPGLVNKPGYGNRPIMLSA